MSDFLEELKKQTDALHKQAHTLDFFNAVLKDTLPLECYVGQLRILAIIYTALESQIVQSGLKLPNNYVKKLPLLLDDISYLQNDYKENTIAINMALKIADDILLLGSKKSYGLLGYLYTLEGSLQGSNVILKNIREQYKLTNKGTLFFQSYKDNLKDYWNDFKIFLNTYKEHKEEIILSSNKCFESLIDVYVALYPHNESNRFFHSAVLNPEAGNHIVPSDEHEIKIAIEANKDCWYHYPYFELRYKQRGFNFGISSVAWTITLSQFSKKEAIEQITWLTRVLSKKGLPTIIMESQLKFLLNRLNSNNYSILFDLLEHLKNKRESVLSDQEFDKYVDIFEKNIPLDLSRKLKNMGMLVISSIVDEKNGYDQSYNHIIDFFDNDIFNTTQSKELKSSAQKLYDLIN